MNYNDYIYVDETSGQIKLRAAVPMAAGTVLDKCIVRAPDDQYWFVWQDDKFVFGSGYSQLYNHSDAPNVVVHRDYAENVMYFCATRVIRSGEELCHQYPDWSRYTAVSHGTPSEFEPMPPTTMQPLHAVWPNLRRMQRSGLMLGPSTIDRIGVFATEDIEIGELVEVALVQPIRQDAWYEWHDGAAVFGSGASQLFGIGTANVAVIRDYKEGKLLFLCDREVAAGEELCVQDRNIRNIY